MQLSQGFEHKYVRLRGPNAGEVETVPPPEAIPGATVVPLPVITDPFSQVTTYALGGTPVNEVPGGVYSRIVELYAAAGDNILQLTNFRRVDTAAPTGWSLSADRQRVLFGASANPFGTNPGENCQLFSIDTLGSDLRQVTRCDKGEQSAPGCGFFPGQSGFEWVGSQASTDTVLFYSTCDSLTANADSGEVFAMRSDGTSIQQLTHTRGMVTEADGTVTLELPGPVAYGARE